MGYIILDIETVPIEFSDIKIAEYLENKKFIKSLHPLFSKLILIGIKEPRKKPKFFFDDNESKILTSFWNYIEKKQIERIVTFNGYSFDIPFINVRSIINGIKIKVDINLNRWYMEDSNHFDCILVFSQKGVFVPPSLEIICRMYNISIDESIIKADQIAGHYEKKNWQPIIEHNKQDLIITEKLYKKIKV